MTYCDFPKVWEKKTKKKKNEIIEESFEGAYLWQIWLKPEMKFILPQGTLILV